MKIKLQEILDKRNISVYSLSKEIGVTQNNLGKLVKGETTSIKYDILEKLCNILNITPNDIFEIEPQLNLFNEIDTNTPKKTLLSETLEMIDKIKNENSSKSLTNVSDEIMQIQERLDLEYALEENLESIIDDIISNSDLSTLPIRIRKEIEAYTEQKVTSFQFKFILSYRSLYTLIVKQSNNKPIIDFIAKMIKIYSNGGLYEISDSDLEDLINESSELLKSYELQKD